MRPETSTRYILVIALSAAVVLLGCPGEGTEPQVPNGGNGDNGNGLCIDDVDCPDGESCVSGVCEPATGPCVRDSDCGELERCDTLSGQCVPVTGNGNGGNEYECEAGETRCEGDDLETCNAARDGWDAEACSGTCYSGACVACVPGDRTCEGDVSRVCNAEGTEWEETDCAAAGGSCDGGVCQICTPNEQRCVDATAYEVCNGTGSGWDVFPCLDMVCEAGQCVDGTSGCEPGETRSCEGSVAVVCAADGESWDQVEDCAVSGGGCQDGFCTDLCSQAVANNSYIGCEYWPVALSNSTLDSRFHSDFGVVVSNPNPGTTAEISVYNAAGSTVATATVAGGELQTINLPWNAMSARSGGSPVTQKGAIAYRLESSVPVTAYQFNPFSSSVNQSCLDGTGNPCYSHTNDASLLLPTHVYGASSQYVAMGLPHMDLRVRDCPFAICSTVLQSEMPTIVAVVATEDNTQVRLRLRGATASGGGLGQLNAGADTTVTLNRHEVLQLASRTAGTATTHEETNNYGIGWEEYRYREYRQSDLTGSIIDADKPIAVYSGADCRFVPYNEWACDHMEQQLFPFHNWGSSYVGSVAQTPPGGSNVGDVWRLVAAVDGTQVTFSPSVHSNVQLDAGQWVQFQTAQNFHVATQGPEHPIMLSQFFVGQNAHGSSMGDPSMILSVPTEQYRTDFAFITPSTIARNYINAVRPTGATVELNGTALPSDCWQNVTGTSYQVCRHEVPGGIHSVTSSAPIGLTVYGFDSYVSYGYPAGLELESLIDFDPGW